MSMSQRVSVLVYGLVSIFLLNGCGDDHGHDHPHPHPHPHKSDSANAADDHGATVELGTLSVSGRKFKVLQLGDLTPEAEGAFEVHGVSMSEAELARLSLYLWIEDAAGTQLSAPTKGNREGEGLHFHVTPRAGKGTPERVVLRVRTGDVDERGTLPLDGHGHSHDDEGPHHGIRASFSGAGQSGYLELKLHDDKGDLELWLAHDEPMTRPFDLPLDSEVQVEFVDVDGREVALRVRNRERNEDEDGNGNIRGAGTNYFIYPSRDGEDASWLKGTEFASIVIVTFTLQGKNLRSEEFVLQPHTH